MSIRVPYETVKSTVTQAFLNLGLSQRRLKSALRSTPRAVWKASRATA